MSAVYQSNDAVEPSRWNTIPTDGVGRRLAFARWVASPRNTLTARVMVNRVWQMHFGTGLVATPNNFGKTGARPSHPDLLDWLATWFIEHGWSIKQLHALIMKSAVYQRASTHPDMANVRKLDARNAGLSYFPPRRLSAEEIRDTMLAVTGELSQAMGGPGIFPVINEDVAVQPRHIMGGIAPIYQPSPRPEQRNRRTIYAFRYRGLADPMLEVFNKPGSESSCERREENNRHATGLCLVQQPIRARSSAGICGPAIPRGEHGCPHESIAPLPWPLAGRRQQKNGNVAWLMSSR
ncbi:MAG: hypothetical protein KatS3mg105_3898 [Gemmatales bacterium]|nr:MAG: hypothetical protein KatS3mg105_3898 [Gemmatales bacterium]